MYYLQHYFANFRKPTKLPAPTYVSCLMEWIEAQINNEAVFPTMTDHGFPKNFISICKKILTRLFRVFVHVYIHHFDRIVALGAVRAQTSIVFLLFPNVMPVNLSMKLTCPF